MAARHRRDGIENIDDFADESTVDTAGDAFAATVQKCSAHIRSDGDDTNGTGTDRAEKLETDRIGEHDRHRSCGKRADGPEKGKEREVVKLNGDQDHSEDKPGYDNHDGGCPVVSSPISIITTALPTCGEGGVGVRRLFCSQATTSGPLWTQAAEPPDAVDRSTGPAGTD